MGTVLIFSVAVAVIIGLAITTHLRLSALEGTEKPGEESAEHVLNEILTSKPVHSEEEDQKEGYSDGEGESESGSEASE